MRLISHLRKKMKAAHFSRWASLSFLLVLQTCDFSQCSAASTHHDQLCGSFKITSLYFTTIPNGPAVVSWTGGDNATHVDVLIASEDATGKQLGVIAGKDDTPGSARQVSIPVDGPTVQNIINIGGTFEVNTDAYVPDNGNTEKCPSYLDLSGKALLPTVVPTAVPATFPPTQTASPKATALVCNYTAGADCFKKGCYFPNSHAWQLQC